MHDAYDLFTILALQRFTVLWINPCKDDVVVTYVASFNWLK